MTYDTNYLSHHGILGMHWGVRRFQNKDGSLTSAGKKRYDNYNENLDIKKRIEANKIDAKTSNIKRRAAALNSILGGLGTTRIEAYENKIKYNDYINAVKNDMKYQKERNLLRSKGNIDKNTGFVLKTSNMSIEEDMKRVNPMYKDFSEGTKSNSMLCAITYDLRRRGYDVTANRSAIEYTDKEALSFYKNAKIEKRRYKNDIDAVDKLPLELKKQGNKARGILIVSDLKGIKMNLSYEIVDDTIKLMDTNENFTTNLYNIMPRLDVKDMRYIRTDNVEIDPKTIKEAAH